MPIKTGGGLETISLVITQEQASRLRALRDIQRTSSRRVSLSDVAREVIEVGLGGLLFARDTASTATVTPSQNAEAA